MFELGRHYRTLVPVSCQLPIGTLSPAPVAQKLSASTGSKSCWNTVKSWLERCKLQHAECRIASMHSGWLPSRLVDVVQHGDEVVRVVSTAGFDLANTIYLSLSHCWRRKEFLTLNKANQKTFEAGILQNRLGTNFCNAFHITRDHGFRYTWIDSLCIIQRFKEDWEREAPLLNMAYKYAFLTIAAADSIDACGVLFRKQNPFLVALQEIEFALRETSLEGIDRRNMLQQKADLQVESSPWVDQITDAPLNTRTWVQQERVFSLRILYFEKTRCSRSANPWKLVKCICCP